MKRLRRLAGRRRLSEWIWWCVLGLFVAAGLVLFVLHHSHQDSFRMPIQETSTEFVEVPERLNFTQELLSSTSFARQLVDQMSLAKAYVIIAKEHNNLNLAWELSSQIRNCQRLLSKAATEAKSITIEEALPVISRMSKLIYKAQDSHYDISTTITTLKKHVEALDERAVAAAVQSAELGQLATEAMPKDLHCLSTRLTEEWFEDPAIEQLAEERRNSQRLVDNNLYHFCVFSDNVIATSALINSTVSNAEHPQQFVFHVVTDRVNYRAMMAWFLKVNFKGCMVDVKSIDDLSWLNSSYSLLVKQLAVGDTKFTSPKSDFFLSHLRFYLLELHPALEKVVFLEDDVVVLKDLTPLFSLDMHGNVIGAVETCLESFQRLSSYLNFSNPMISSRFDPQACAWAFGMNVFDLIAWKKANATAKYHYWQEQNEDETIWKAGTLVPGLLTFYGMVEPLDRRWHVTSLGYKPDLDERLIESAAAVHFSGNRKPWLRLAIDRYKPLWQQYVDRTHPHIQYCTSQA
ncbi:putative galacturonosyltransferase 11 [Iris pallida]|uniref:Hexosyltransferase n=1 Tax=Iris pallida TaxID=29817 RepID=A0AAX6DPP7_IRIPA|nr:putative galacturonosyltransferase 11 [Iris pallida]